MEHCRWKSKQILINQLYKKLMTGKTAAPIATSLPSPPSKKLEYNSPSSLNGGKDGEAKMGAVVLPALRLRKGDLLKCSLDFHQQYLSDNYSQSML